MPNKVCGFVDFRSQMMYVYYASRMRWSREASFNLPAAGRGGGAQTGIQDRKLGMFSEILTGKDSWQPECFWVMSFFSSSVPLVFSWICFLLRLLLKLQSRLIPSSDLKTQFEISRNLAKAGINFLFQTPHCGSLILLALISSLSCYLSVPNMFQM